MPGEAFDLDRALLGSDVCDDVALRVTGGAVVVSVRPLTRAEVSRLGLSVADLSRDSAANEVIRAATRHRALCLACSLKGAPAFETPDEVGVMPAEMVGELWSALLRVHARAHLVTADAAHAMTERSKEPAFNVDRLRAHHAETIRSYYGLARAADATAIQVEWIARLVERPK